MFIITVFDQLLTRSSSVSSQDFYCPLLKDESRDVIPRLGVFVIFQCTSFRLCIFIPAAIITTI